MELINAQQRAHTKNVSLHYSHEISHRPLNDERKNVNKIFMMIQKVYLSQKEKFHLNRHAFSIGAPFVLMCNESLTHALTGL